MTGGGAKHEILSYLNAEEDGQEESKAEEGSHNNRDNDGSWNSLVRSFGLLSKLSWPAGRHTNAMRHSLFSNRPHMRAVYCEHPVAGGICMMECSC